MTDHDLDDARKYIDQYSRDGGYLVRLCSDMLFNFSVPPEDQREGLLEFYRRSLALLGNRLRFVKNGESARWKPVAKDPSTLLEAWLDKPSRKASHVLALEGSEQPDRVSDAAFEFCWVLGTGYVRLVLPAEALVDDAEQFRSTAMELATLVRFSSGSAGYSANIHLDHDSSSDDSAIGRIGGRYPGVDLGKPLYWSDLVVHGLKSINWLTFLGPDFVSKATAGAPDRATFVTSLGPQALVSPLAHGLMIQAGAQARLDDQDDGGLSAYREVGRALHPLKIPAHVLRGYDGIGGTENTRTWLNRFEQ
jgi:hypothetical protein